MATAPPSANLTIVNTLNTDVLVKYTYWGDIAISMAESMARTTRASTMAIARQLSTWYNGDLNSRWNRERIGLQRLRTSTFNAQGARMTSEIATPRSPAVVAVDSTACTTFCRICHQGDSDQTRHAHILNWILDQS